MLELKYRAERCFFILKNIIGIEELSTEQIWKKKRTKTLIKKINTFLKSEDKNGIQDIIGNDKEGTDLPFSDLLSFLICEAFFCLRELIKMIKLYEPGYVIGYSFIAEAHNRMGDWCHVYDNYRYILNYAIGDVTDISVLEKKLSKEKVKLNEVSRRTRIEIKIEIKILEDKVTFSKKLKKFNTEITEMLGQESLAYLESKNHYESAIQYYYKVIQLHSDGKAYRDKLHDIYMLEDDYNDNTTHYIIASERISNVT